jgi:hypothetical protein
MDFLEPEGLGDCVLPHVGKQEKEDLHRETKKLKIYEEATLFVVEKCHKTVEYLDLAIKTSSDQRNEASRVRENPQLSLNRLMGFRPRGHTSYRIDTSRSTTPTSATPDSSTQAWFASSST